MKLLWEQAPPACGSVDVRYSVTASGRAWELGDSKAPLHDSGPPMSVVSQDADARSSA